MVTLKGDAIHNLEAQQLHYLVGEELWTSLCIMLKF